MLTIEQRQRYAPGVGIAWVFLPALIVLSLLAGLGLAWGLKLAYYHDWYLILLLPIVGGFALGGALYLLVGWARCRNRWLAAALGVVAGLIGYLGYYELCLLDIVPPELACRADFLTHYIKLRMQTDVARDLGAPNDPQANQKPSAGLNWYSFFCELLMVSGAAGYCAWNRARRAYCPELGRWMQRETALLPPESVQGFREAMEMGSLADFVAGTTPASNAQTGWRCVVEYAAPAEGSALAYPVYLSLEPPTAKHLWHFLPGRRRGSFRQVRIDTDEILTMRPLFPKLSQLLASQHAELTDLPHGVTPAPAVEATVTDVARIAPVLEPYRRRVRSKGYALWVNLIGLTTGIYFFGGGGLAALGVWLATEKGLPLAWAAVVVGAIGFLWGGYVGLYCPSVPENRWINRRLRREIGQRPDTTVDPRDSQARYVSLIPRESFSKIQWTMASDLLLLKIDPRGRRLVLEGDCDRYLIPAGSISLCQPECFFHPIDKQNRNELWMARLMVRVEEGMRELLLSVDHIGWTPMTNAGRRKTAEAFCQEVNRL